MVFLSRVFAVGEVLGMRNLWCLGSEIVNRMNVLWTFEHGSRKMVKSGEVNNLMLWK